MANEKKKNQTDNMNKPLFTGDAMRDMNVSEGEKAAEASKALFHDVKEKLEKKLSDVEDLDLHTSHPIFTGDALRDMNVSEGEKAAEASEAIFDAVKDKVKKK